MILFEINNEEYSFYLEDLIETLKSDRDILNSKIDMKQLNDLIAIECIHLPIKKIYNNIEDLHDDNNKEVLVQDQFNQFKIFKNKIGDKYYELGKYINTNEFLELIFLLSSVNIDFHKYSEY